MKLGFIGFGNMGGAIAAGIIKNGFAAPQDIIVSDKFEAGLQKAKDTYGVTTTIDNLEVVANADVIILAVKPQIIADVIAEIKDAVKENQLIISIAAGKTIGFLEENFAKTVKIVRCMPNTPALVLEGCTGICFNDLVSAEEKELAMKLFNCLGKGFEVPEKLIDVVVGVSGSSPAYVFMFMEAMADAAVMMGMPRNQAYEFTAQAVLGSAKLMMETGKHPGELKDMVCSPGGTTIEAVKVLEEKGMRAAVIDAVVRCVEKSKEL